MTTDADVGLGVLTGAVVVAIIAALIIGVISTIKNDYHIRWCDERLAHAQVSQDTLAIVQDDDFCLQYSKDR